MATKKKAGKKPVGKPVEVVDAFGFDSVKQSFKTLQEQLYREKSHRFDDNEKRVLALALEGRIQMLLSASRKAKCQSARKVFDTEADKTHALACKIYLSPTQGVGATWEPQTIRMPADEFDYAMGDVKL